MKIKMTQLTQPTKYSCVTTSLAVLLGLTRPNDVVEQYHPQFFDGSKDVYAIMDELNINYRRPQRAGRNTLKKNKTYLVSIPSLNIPGGMHQVVFQVTSNWNIIVFDPAEGRPGRKFYQSTHLPLADNCVHPITWDIDAEIFGIELIKLDIQDETRGNIQSAARNEGFRKDHDYDFQEFLDKQDRPVKKDNYDLAP